MEIEEIQQQVIDAKTVQITGEKTNNPSYLSLANYAGIVEYFPEELVMTVKAGTTLNAIQQCLAENGQGMPFPIIDDEKATIGGAYAIGNALLRDAVLGIKIIDGQGRILSFGGQVMKNVAGYDVTRLLVGSQGKLAVICEISFKVLPRAYLTLEPAVGKNEVTGSALRTQIEQGLKQVFDPRGVFI